VQRVSPVEGKTCPSWMKTGNCIQLIAPERASQTLGPTVWLATKGYNVIISIEQRVARPASPGSVAASKFAGSAGGRSTLNPSLPQVLNLSGHRQRVICRTSVAPSARVQNLSSLFPLGRPSHHRGTAEHLIRSRCRWPRDPTTDLPVLCRNVI